MDRFAGFIVKHRKTVVVFFILASIVCMLLSNLVGVNYDIMDYLPDGVPSTVALDTMSQEYDQAIPNMRVMVKTDSVSEALDYKARLASVEGVEAVEWLDDAADIYAPIETIDQSVTDDWYKDGTALYSVTVKDEKETEAVNAVREIIGEDNAMTGSAVVNALAPVITSKEISTSIGVAILINRGTNLMFGEISFVTNAAGAVLQLAVSMDYSIFLLHRFSEFRSEGHDVSAAMVLAVKKSTASILSSGLTTVTGFAALILMQFKIGPDMGWVMAKAILFSLIAVLVLLPAAAICTYKLIDKTRHRPFIPGFERFSRFALKLRAPFLILFCLLVVPSFLASQNNQFIYGASKIYSSAATQMGRDMTAIEETYGKSSPLVLMVPAGDITREKQMNDAILQAENVTSVVSYVNTVSDVIPPEFTPEGEISKLYSEHYSRFVVNMDIVETDPGAFEKVDAVRSIAADYYGDGALIAGDLPNAEDLRNTIVHDNILVNGVAVGFVLLILIFNFKSLSLPFILTLVIEGSIWLNLAVPYFRGEELNYIAYLITSSVQLGATIDYGILFTDRFLENRRLLPKKEALRLTIQSTTVSIMTSASIMTIAGCLLGRISTNAVLSQLGVLIGRGALISMTLVIFVLPAILSVCDGVIEKTTWKARFYKKNDKFERKAAYEH